MIKQLETQCKKAGICQYKKAAKKLALKNYYIRGRNYMPNDGGRPAHVDVYVINNDTVELLCYNTTKHRACVLLQLFQKNEIQHIDESIINNYKHNGWTTRCGIKRAVKKLDRIKKIEQSHIVCNESGKAAHDYRVHLRNAIFTA